MPQNTSMQVMNSDQRYAAVMARDPRADGSFVYAVKSTGVFCRPSCASRRPRADRIAFFSTPVDARQAGYRACRRCQPDGRPSGNVVEQVCRYIEKSEDSPRLSELASQFALSPHHLARIFKEQVGMTPKAYADLRRVERLKGLLREGSSVTNALYSAGYGSSSRLYERGAKLIGMTPADYRRGGKGTAIAFTIVDTTLGKLLVATTDRGICSVKLGQSASALERALFQEYAAASVQRDDTALADSVAPIVRHIDKGEPLGTLATDVQGTAFTRGVWKALMAIPSGQTRTYGQIAAAIGRPTAARAVARACATNKVAIVIPCHRVVPSSGGTGGYRWGAERKRKLLRRERDATLETHEAK